MALAFDAASGSTELSGLATTLTYAHTCTGNNLILLVGVMIATASDKVSGVTYAGTAMTLINKVTVTGHYSYLFYLLNPATGANNVVVTVTSAESMWSSAESLTGALQSGQPDSQATGTGTTSVTLSTTVVLANCWLVSTAESHAANLAASTGTTSRNLQNSTYGEGIGDSNGTVGTGAQTMAWTGSDPMAGVIASIAPFTVAADNRGYSYFL